MAPIPPVDSPHDRAGGEPLSSSSGEAQAANGPLAASLPDPPEIRVVVAADHTPSALATGGFFDLQRLDLVIRYSDGTASPPFPYDVGEREALDAVVLAAYFEDSGTFYVYLRSAIRPPCALRPIPPFHDGSLWELPAGLVEEGEDPAETAVRELGEELGFSVSPDAMQPLGPWTFPSPGIIGERHLFFAVEVDPRARRTPTEDGSALERGAEVIALPVQAVLRRCALGEIRDAKTELGVRRLAELL